MTRLVPAPIRGDQNRTTRDGDLPRNAIQVDASASTPDSVTVDSRRVELSLEQALRRAFRFTRSEARVALLLAARSSNREIAEELDVTEHTARRHTEKVLSKLGIHHRIEVREMVAKRVSAVRPPLELC